MAPARPGVFSPLDLPIIALGSPVALRRV